MARGPSNILAIGLVRIIVGSALSEDPCCNRGRQTIVPNLIAHGLRNLVRAFRA